MEITRENIVDVINGLTQEQKDFIKKDNGELFEVLDNVKIGIELFEEGENEDNDKFINGTINYLSKLLNNESGSEKVEQVEPETDYVENGGIEKKEFESKTKPNVNAKSIYEIFTLEQLRSLLGGYLSKDKKTLNITTYRVKGFFVSPKITYDEAKQDYVVSCYTKKSSGKTSQEVYEKINKRISEELIEQMWGFAKGLISPIANNANVKQIEFESGELENIEDEDEVEITNCEEIEDVEVVVGNYEPIKDNVSLPKDNKVTEIVEKYCGNGFSKNQIKAYVFYRQCFGVPMNGWEDYFLKSYKNVPNAEDRFYIGEEKGELVFAKQNLNSACGRGKYYEGMKLGVLIKKTQEFVFVIDEDFHSNVFLVEDVELRENNSYWSKEDVYELLGDSLFARDFEIPKCSIKKSLFIPKQLSINNSGKRQILDAETLTFFDYNGDEETFVDETGTIKLKLSTIFNDDKDNKDTNVKKYKLPQSINDVLRTMLYTSFDEDGSGRLRRGMNGDGITPKKDKYGNMVIQQRGLGWCCSQLCNDYDVNKQNSTLITDYVYMFKGKNGRNYIIPYMAVNVEDVVFDNFETTILLPKNAFFQGNLRLLLKSYEKGRQIFVKPKAKTNLEKQMQSEDELEDNGHYETLDNYEVKYNKYFGDLLKLGTKQKEMIINEIGRYVRTFDVKATINSGNRPHIGILSRLAKMDIVESINGQSIYNILSADRSIINALRTSGILDIPYIPYDYDVEKDKPIKTSLRSAFAIYLQTILPTNEISTETNRKDILKYYINDRKLSSKESESLNDKIANEMSSAKAEGERLFSNFLAESLSKDCVRQINDIFNTEESFATTNLYNYVPIGFVANKSVFSKKTFLLNKAQLDGIRFLTQYGSGLLMHDVGFGKTLCSIHSLACKLTSGEVKRPLVVVPKMVYANWCKEMFGGWKDDNNKIYFIPNKNLCFESGVFTGTDVNLLLIGNCSTSSVSGSGLDSKNFTLYDSNWKKIKSFTIDALKEQNIPPKTIILATHSAIEKNLTLSDDTRDNVIDYSISIINENENCDTSFVSKCLTGNTNNKVLVDKIGADYLVVDEAHNFKSLLKGKGLVKGTPQRSSMAVKMFNLTTYFSLYHGNSVNFLTATPFTNNTAEIFGMLLFVNQKHLRLDIAENTLSSFQSMFVSPKFDRKVTTSLAVKTEWVVGRFNNRIILKNNLSTFINNNFESSNAGVYRPSKINYPNFKVGTFFAEGELQKQVRTLVQGEILNCPTKVSKFFKTYNVYSSNARKKDVVLPQISKYEEMVKNDLFDEDFLSWYRLYELAKFPSNHFEEFDIHSKEELIIEKINCGTPKEKWKVLKLVVAFEENNQAKINLYTDVNKEFIAMNMLNLLSLCPYYITPNYEGYSECFESTYLKISSLVDLNNVTIDEFISNCSKLDYVANCIKSVNVYHEKNRNEILQNTRTQLIVEEGEKLTEKEINKCLESYPSMSGQVVYVGFGAGNIDEDRDTSGWSKETKERYCGKTVLEIFKEYLIDKCGFYEEVKLGGKTYKQVEIISGNTSEDDRLNIQDLFNGGKIHVIIGTSAIKEGINLQKRSSVLYCCTLDWNPTDFKQLEGRIWRQGNEFQFVRIVTPLMQNSLDSFIYQKMGEKQSRIGSIFDASNSNTADLSFAISEDELKFQILSDVDELTKLEIKDRYIKLKKKIQPLVSRIQDNFGFYINSGYKKGGMIEGLEHATLYNKKFIEHIEKLRNFWSNAVEHFDDAIKIYFDNFEKEQREWLLDDYKKDEIGECKTNLQDREVVDKDENGRPKKDENGNVLKKIQFGVLSLEKIKKLKEKWKKYVDICDKIIKAKGEKYLPTEVFSDWALNTINNTDEEESFLMSLSFKIQKTDYDDDGNEIRVDTQVKKIQTQRISCYLYGTSFQYPKPECDFIDVKGSRMRSFETLLAECKKISKQIDNLLRNRIIEKDFSVEELIINANNTLVKLFGTPDSFKENNRISSDSLKYALRYILGETISYDDSNTNHLIGLYSNLMANESESEIDVYRDNEDEEEKEGSEENTKKVLFTDTTKTEDTFLYKMILLDTEAERNSIRTYIEKMLAERNKKTKNARQVASFFAKYNYLLSEKFGRKKTSRLPKYVSNDDAILGIENVRKYIALNDVDLESTRLKLIKVRDFVPFSQYQKLSENIADNIKEINNLYYNVYAMFSTTDYETPCLRYISKEGGEGFYVYANNRNETKQKVSIFTQFDEDLIDENFSTTSTYDAKKFVVIDGKETISGNATACDFSKENQYSIDLSFKTSVKFDDSELYNYETKEIEEEIKAEKEKFDKLKSNLTELNEKLSKYEITSIVTDNQIAEKITIENSRNMLPKLTSYLSSGLLDDVLSYNEDDSIMSNVIIVASQIANEFDEVRDLLLPIIHILNLCIGYDDSEDQAEYIRRENEIREYEKSLKENEIKAVKQAKENANKKEKSNEDLEREAIELSKSKMRMKLMLLKARK